MTEPEQVPPVIPANVTDLATITEDGIATLPPNSEMARAVHAVFDGVPSPE